MYAFSMPVPDLQDNTSRNTSGMKGMNGRQIPLSQNPLHCRAAETCSTHVAGMIPVNAKAVWGLYQVGGAHGVAPALKAQMPPPKDGYVKNWEEGKQEHPWIL